MRWSVMIIATCLAKVFRGFAFNNFFDISSWVFDDCFTNNINTTFSFGYKSIWSTSSIICTDFSIYSSLYHLLFNFFILSSDLFFENFMLFLNFFGFQNFLFHKFITSFFESLTISGFVFSSNEWFCLFKLSFLLASK